MTSAVLVLRRPDRGGMHLRMSELAEGVQGLHIVFLDSGTARRWSAPLRELLNARRLLAQPAVRLVLAPGFSTLIVTSLAALAVRRRQRPRQVALLRNSLAEVESWSSMRQQVLRWSIRRSSRSVVMSPELADELRRFEPAAQVQVIRNAIPRTATTRAIRRPFRDGGSVHVAWVGRLTDSKDPELAIRTFAAADLPSGSTLSIVGAGPLESQCEQLTEHLGIARRVEFEGWVDDVPAYLAGADILLVTSRFEGSSMQMVEAMSVGTPVLAVDCPSSHRDTLLNGEAGVLVHTRDARQIGVALAEASASRAGLDQLGRVALDRAGDFDFDQMIKQYSALIAEQLDD